MTNAKFAENKRFKRYCSEVGVPPTKRQASKFRNGKGKVYQAQPKRSVK